MISELFSSEISMLSNLIGKIALCAAGNGDCLMAATANLAERRLVSLILFRRPIRSSWPISADALT